MNIKLCSNSPIVTVFGGTGFVGRYIVRRLVKSGWRVRVAVRNPNSAIFLKTYGEVGQVEICYCSIFDPDTAAKCISGSSVVINAVAGLLNETSNKKFKQYYVDWPEMVAILSTKFDVKQFIHISSIGANISSNSIYASSKAKGEEKILNNFSNTVILRPSLIFGHEDRFFNRYAAMASYSLVIPLIGPSTKFQPVYVDDVALVVEKVLKDSIFKGIFELGGPEVLTFEETIKKMLTVIRRKRLLFNIPFGPAKLIASIFALMNRVSLGIVKPPFTVDNVKQLKNDNIVSKMENSFEDLGIKPQNIDTIIPLYLYAYRPYGQYNDITASAKK
jgi:NADH dehydrogenase